MTAFFNQFIIALQERIKTQVPEIQYIEMDMGQIDEYEVRPSIAFPGVLLDINATYEQRQLATQWGQADVQLRLAFDQWGHSSSLSTQQIREQALYYFELENKIYLALQDWYGDGLLMNPMERVSAATEKRADFRIRNLHFRCTYEDRGQNP